MNGNQVLVYNSSHVQLAAKTIANNIAGPTGVAFDWNGNLWVTNATGSLVAEYVTERCLYRRNHRRSQQP
jgi:DNA-binding beta-propeller fold protein YncE